MISQKAHYGLQALSLLAHEYGHGPQAIVDLAKQENIPRKYLEHILLQLKHSGILQSRKGKGGGYTLLRPPAEISLGQIIQSLDGPLLPMECLGSASNRRCRLCHHGNACGIRLVMKDVADAITGLLEQTTLQSLQERSAEALKQQQGVVDFQI